MATKRNLRSRNKRRVTKKRRVHRRTKKHISKRRSRYSRRGYQRGGKLCKRDTEKVRKALQKRVFENKDKLSEAEIENFLDSVQRQAGVLSRKDLYKHLLNTIRDMPTKENLMDWINDSVSFEEYTAVSNDEYSDSDNQYSSDVSTDFSKSDDIESESESESDKKWFPNSCSYQNLGYPKVLRPGSSIFHFPNRLHDKKSKKSKS